MLTNDIGSDVRLGFGHSLLCSALSGLFFAFVGAVIWAALGVLFDIQLGYAAVAVAFLVGLGVRLFAIDTRLAYGLLGAFVSVLGVVSGKVFLFFGYVIADSLPDLASALWGIQLENIAIYLQEEFTTIDLLFYALALFVGFSSAINGKILPQRFASLMEPVEAGRVEGPEKFKMSSYLPAALPLLLCIIPLAFLFAPFTGEMQIRDEEGVLLREGPIENGREEGEWIYYYEDGTVETELTFERGLLHGTYSTHYPDGQVHVRGNFAYELEHGNWQFFYPSGVLSEEMSFENGLLEGPWRGYDEDGELNYVLEYRNGVEVEVHYYSLPGELAEHSTNFDNEFRILTYLWQGSDVQDGNGWMEEFGPQGYITQSGQVRGGFRDGPWTAYAEDGGVVRDIEFREGVERTVQYYVDGVAVLNEGSGEVVLGNAKSGFQERLSFVDGFQEGRAETYFQNGQVQAFQTYKNGILDGPYGSFEADGSLAEEGAYLDGLRTGEHRRFEAGVLVVSGYSAPALEEDIFTQAVLVYRDPAVYQYSNSSNDFETFSLVLGTEGYDASVSPFEQFESDQLIAIFEFQFLWNRSIDLADPEIMLASALSLRPYGAIYSDGELHFFRPGSMDYLETENGVLSLQGTLNFNGEMRNIQFAGRISTLAIDRHPGVK